MTLINAHFLAVRSGRAFCSGARAMSWLRIRAGVTSCSKTVSASSHSSTCAVAQSTTAPPSCCRACRPAKCSAGRWTRITAAVSAASWPCRPTTSRSARPPSPTTTSFSSPQTPTDTSRRAMHALMFSCRRVSLQPARNQDFFCSSWVQNLQRIFLLTPILFMGPEALCFRVVRLSVRACPGGGVLRPACRQLLVHFCSSTSHSNRRRGTACIRSRFVKILQVTLFVVAGARIRSSLASFAPVSLCTTDCLRALGQVCIIPSEMWALWRGLRQETDGFAGTYCG